MMRLDELMGLIKKAEDNGDVQLKAELLKEATELSLKLYGRGSKTHLALQSEYGGMLRYIGKTKEAIRVLAEVCELCAPCCSQVTDEYCTSLINLASAYLYDDNLEESEKLFLEAKNALPMKDYRYASICNNMSALYQKQGRYDKAISTMEEALSIIPDDQVDYIEEYCSTLSNLAYVIISMAEAVKDRIEDTKPLLERANEYLSIAVNKLHQFNKDDQVLYASIINQKASILALLEEYAYALAFYKEAYDICQAKLGPQSSAAITIASNIAHLENLIGI